MSVALLTEHNLEFLSLTGGCIGSSESTLVTLLEITWRGTWYLLRSYYLLLFCIISLIICHTLVNRPFYRSIRILIMHIDIPCWIYKYAVSIFDKQPVQSDCSPAGLLFLIFDIYLTSMDLQSGPKPVLVPADLDQHNFQKRLYIRSASMKINVSHDMYIISHYIHSYIYDYLLIFRWVRDIRYTTPYATSVWDYLKY